MGTEHVPGHWWILFDGPPFLLIKAPADNFRVFLGMQGGDSFSYRGAESLGQRDAGGVCDWWLFRNGPAKLRKQKMQQSKGVWMRLSLRDALCYRKRRVIL